MTEYSGESLITAKKKNQKLIILSLVRFAKAKLLRIHVNKKGLGDVSGQTKPQVLILIRQTPKPYTNDKDNPECRFYQQEYLCWS